MQPLREAVSGVAVELFYQPQISIKTYLLINIVITIIIIVIIHKYYDSRCLLWLTF